MGLLFEGYVPRTGPDVVIGMEPIMNVIVGRSAADS